MVNNELVLLTVAIFLGVLSVILTAWILRAAFFYLRGLLLYLFDRALHLLDFVMAFLKAKIAEYRAHAN